MATLRFSAGGATAEISLPDLRIPEPADASYFRARIESWGAGTIEALNTGFDLNSALTMFSNIAAFAVPYGTAVAAGIRVGQFVAGLFGGGDGDLPPPPDIAGVDQDALAGRPLADPNRAVLAARIVAGEIRDVDPQLVADIQQTARETFRRAMDAMVAVPEGGRWGRAVNTALQGPPYNSDLRALAYFCAYLPYSTLVGQEFTNFRASDTARAAQIGRLLGWAGPRVMLRETLLAWACYRQAQAIRKMLVVDLDANCNAQTEQAAVRRGFAYSRARTGTVEPVPGYEFAAAYDDQADTDWPRTRALCSEIGAQAFLTQILLRVLPIPQAAGDTFTFNPMMQDVIESELNGYYAGVYPLGTSRELYDKVVSGRDVYRFRMPHTSGGDVPLSPFLETWAEALAAAFHLLRVPDRVQRADLPPDFPRDWYDKILRHHNVVDSAVRQARTTVTVRTVFVPALGRQITAVVPAEIRRQTAGMLLGKLPRHRPRRGAVAVSIAAAAAPVVASVVASVVAAARRASA